MGRATIRGVVGLLCLAASVVLQGDDGRAGAPGGSDGSVVLHDRTEWTDGKDSIRRLELSDLRGRPVRDVAGELVEELLGRGCTLVVEPVPSGESASGTVLESTPKGEFPSRTQVRIRVSFPAGS